MVGQRLADQRPIYDSNIPVQMQVCLYKINYKDKDDTAGKWVQSPNIAFRIRIANESYSYTNLCREILTAVKRGHTGKYSIPEVNQYSTLWTDWALSTTRPEHPSGRVAFVVDWQDEWFVRKTMDEHIFSFTQATKMDGFQETIWQVFMYYLTNRRAEHRAPSISMSELSEALAELPPLYPEAPEDILHDQNILPEAQVHDPVTIENRAPTEAIIIPEDSPQLDAEVHVDPLPTVQPLTTEMAPETQRRLRERRTTRQASRSASRSASRPRPKTKGKGKKKAK
jgi:hypothetical protein